MQPSTKNKGPIYIEYDIRFDPEFKRAIIELLEKLQQDTNAGFNKWTGEWRELPPGVDPMTVYIQWGPTGLKDNRVWIHTFDRDYFQMMRLYQFYEIPVMIKELRLCDVISHDDILTIDWYRLRRSGIIEVYPEQLRGIKQLTLGLGC